MSGEQSGMGVVRVLPGATQSGVFQVRVTNLDFIPRITECHWITSSFSKCA